MTFVVPFDGSSLAEAALARAVEFGRVLDEPVVAVTVVPERNANYAREKGWLGADEEFDRAVVVSSVRGQLRAIAPEVDLETPSIDRYAPPGAIANRIDRFIRDREASMVFVGSENAGRLVTSSSSIGGRLAAKEDYDVVIVRRRGPTRVEAAAAQSPSFDPEADITPEGEDGNPDEE